ncbi:transcriptional regulator, GntR family with aminotransferase domain [Paenibacillus vortex V453]|uniref:Transcriptional regulator, GntR family with aminotransferase domain n=1 Tax=Paenibacillus vortex V453 TaxID=715225 RepID=A0A2R9SMX0_9BACL|nr:MULTISPECIES: PLP-dependent aminotransferase family protein [Paenibacillus]EFU38698.1 transcriptional regulator, GntR family with aminotransferase domain [Paenibacillus vortex V453]MDH6673472.1 GntR family transcriptional regulator/MocR family aminotransferase [Paenibacillus sp. LBL]
MELGLPFETYVEQYRYKYLALYHAIRTAIHSGKLPEGTRLPATRELAKLYGVSRGSAAQSYDMLMAEGYVVSRPGSGTYVAKGIAMIDQPPAADRAPVLSAWGQRLMEKSGEYASALMSIQEPPLGTISFANARMPIQDFPYSEWRSALSYAGGSGGTQLQSGAPPEGDTELRQAIAGHLRFTRGIQVDPEHIVIFSGSMQGLVLLFQLLVDPGDHVVMEDPGYQGIHRGVSLSGGIPLPSPVDEAGLIPRDWDAGLLVVSPSRQYPTGAVLPLERRRALLNWARSRQAFIIEDDYDSEFRWGGKPIEPLKMLDDEGRVIFVGSFSKTMFTGLRIGYAVLPPSLVEAVVQAKALYEPISPAVLEQRALARFIVRGGYGRHLRRMTRLYGARYEALHQAMDAYASDLFCLHSGDAGLHVYANWLRSGEEYAALRDAARNRGVMFRDAAVYHLTPGPPAACFGFSHLDASMIEEGVRRIALAWLDMQKT